jgi:hypothetical protein
MLEGNQGIHRTFSRNKFECQRPYFRGTNSPKFMRSEQPLEIFLKTLASLDFRDRQGKNANGILMNQGMKMGPFVV